MENGKQQQGVSQGEQPQQVVDLLTQEASRRPAASEGYNELASMVSDAAKGRRFEKRNYCDEAPSDHDHVDDGSCHPGQNPAAVYTPVAENLKAALPPFAKARKFGLPTGGSVAIAASNTPNSFANNAIQVEFYARYSRHAELDGPNVVITRHCSEYNKDYCFIFSLPSFIMFFSNLEMVYEISRSMAKKVVEDWNRQYESTDSNLSCEESKQIMTFDIKETQYKTVKLILQAENFKFTRRTYKQDLDRRRRCQLEDVQFQIKYMCDKFSKSGLMKGGLVMPYEDWMHLLQHPALEEMVRFARGQLSPSAVNIYIAQQVALLDKYNAEGRRKRELDAGSGDYSSKSHRAEP